MCDTLRRTPPRDVLTPRPTTEIAALGVPARRIIGSDDVHVRLGGAVAVRPLSDVGAAIAAHVTVLTAATAIPLETALGVADVIQVSKPATTVTAIYLPLLSARRRRRFPLGVDSVRTAVVVSPLPPRGVTRRGEMLRLGLRCGHRRLLK